MDILYILFIALANNLDNIGVRIAYSIRGIKISFEKNLWISVITFVISTFAAYSGAIISCLVNKLLLSVISMVLLASIGIGIIRKEYSKKQIIQNSPQKINPQHSVLNILKSPEEADKDDSKSIDFTEATFLGTALSINNIGGGLSAGMIGLNPILTGLLSAILSFVALWAGNYITKFFGTKSSNKKVALISGIILVLIGIKQLF